MASIVTVIDDIDGSQDSTTQTRVFEFGGSQYEIDLSDINAKALAEAQQRFAEAVEAVLVFTNAGRVVSRRKASASAPSRSKEENDAIRSWARRQGVKVSDHGRIPEYVLEAYDKEHAPKVADAEVPQVQDQAVGSDEVASTVETSSPVVPITSASGRKGRATAPAADTEAAEANRK